MEGVVQPYAWGSKTFIPELLGTEPTDEPQAELWLGAHPSAVAKLSVICDKRTWVTSVVCK